MVNKCLAICDGRFVPSRLVGLSRIVQRSRQDRDVDAAYHLDDGNIEFCKKRAEHGFGIRKPTFRSCGSILGLFGVRGNMPGGRDALDLLCITFSIYQVLHNSSLLLCAEVSGSGLRLAGFMIIHKPGFKNNETFIGILDALQQPQVENPCCMEHR